MSLQNWVATSGKDLVIRAVLPDVLPEPLYKFRRNRHVNEAIARVAQQSPNLPGSVVVVDDELPLGTQTQGARPVLG